MNSLTFHGVVDGALKEPCSDVRATSQLPAPSPPPHSSLSLSSFITRAWHPTVSTPYKDTARGIRRPSRHAPAGYISHSTFTLLVSSLSALSLYDLVGRFIVLLRTTPRACALYAAGQPVHLPRGRSCGRLRSRRGACWPDWPARVALSAPNCAWRAW